MFTVAKILEMLPREGGLELKALEKMLKLTKKIERTRLDIALNALSKLNIIEKDNENFVKKSLNVLFSNTSNEKKIQSMGYSQYMQLVRVKNKIDILGKIKNIKIKKSFYKSLEATPLI